MKFRKATPEDAQVLFPKLRECDRKEILLSSGDPTYGVLLRSIEASEEVWAVEDDAGEVFVVYGVAPFGPLGGVWMLASPEVYRHSKRLVRDGRKWVSALLQRYTRLFNFVHAENTRSIAWLRSLGFTIGELVPDFGAGKAPFHLFYQDRPCANQ